MRTSLLGLAGSRLGQLGRASACLLLLACGSSKTATTTSAVTGDDDDQVAQEKEKRDASTKNDASSKPDPKKDAGAKPRGRDGAAASPEPCARAEAKIERLLPRVWLLVDGSGSMSQVVEDDAAGRTRFAVLRDALLDDNGPVAQLQNSIEFGLLIYDGGLSPPGIKTPLCPREIVVEPKVNNFSGIAAAYPQQATGASTPTHYALLDLQMRTHADVSGRRTYVILATDGKPNLCDFHDGIPASAATEQEAVTTVSELAADGIKTYAISMGSNDPELETHLAMIASAGDTGTDVFQPNSGDQLGQALSQILTAAVSCEVQIDG
ncbi:MAG TPA: vWA domain-containing protein, partial [Polyangiales bacterium]